MEPHFKRFWFEFIIKSAFEQPPGIGLGCGVTAIDQNDAIEIMKNKIFIKSGIPAIKKIIENVDIRNLDQGHVIPNMNSPHVRGIWFPQGYE